MMPRIQLLSRPPKTFDTAAPGLRTPRDERCPDPTRRGIGDANQANQSSAKVGARWRLRGSSNLSAVGPFHAADICGRVTVMWLRIRC
jgi:hypothetical protein